jgi:type I restriction enzyme S subunit
MDLTTTKYKQTEVGLLPVDWNIETIEKSCSVKGRVGWKGYTKKDLVAFGPYAIGAKHIDKNNRLDLSDPTCLSLEKYVESPEIFVLQDDLLIVQRGTIGKLVLIDQEIGNATINPSMLIIRSKINTSRFLYYYLLSREGQSQILNDTSSTGVPMITQKQVKAFKIPLPPTLTEQKAIAQVLSDTDALINSLEKLIVKKRHIKQGAMQKLLQPKEGWEVKKLGEVGKCHRGVSYNPERDLHPHDKNITVRLLRSNNIQNQNIDLNGLQFVDQERVKQNQLLLDNDIVICMANGSKQLVGKTAIFKAKDKLNYTFGAFMGCFRTNMDLASSLYIALNFHSFQYRNYIDVLLSGSSINNLNPGNIESIEIPFPPAEEQTRIATILSDMDAEINALESKLEKYKKVKLGMMQNLLTGKIRLI